MKPGIYLSHETVDQASWKALGDWGQVCLTVKQTRQIEEKAFKQSNSWLLMQAAGIRAAQKIESHYKKCLRSKHSKCIILAGPGNNGGDALVVASKLAAKNIPLQVVDFGGKKRGSADRETAKVLCMASGVEWMKPSEVLLSQASVIVDGLLGIGCDRPPSGPMKKCIDSVNILREMSQAATATPAPPVVALDCPSGLDCTTGLCPGTAIKADLTLTFIALKTGLVLNQGAELCGEVWVDSLGCDSLLVHLNQVMTNAHQEQVFRLPQRPAHHHKGNFGSVSVLGGAPGMAGAALLAARAALFLGAGRVAVHQPDTDSHAVELSTLPVDAQFPEIMSKTPTELLPFATVIVAGPGLGNSEDAKTVLADLAKHKKPCPVVLDADALNNLSSNKRLRNAWIKSRQKENATDLVLTPHPLEAARLLDWTAEQVNANRIEAAHELAESFSCVVVLKGAGTVICAENYVAINCTGGPALATAGSGDVLAGAIGAFLAQGLNGFNAATCAVWLHGWCTGAFADNQPRLLLSHASEIVQRMKVAYNDLLNERSRAHS